MWPPCRPKMRSTPRATRKRATSSATVRPVLAFMGYSFETTNRPRHAGELKTVEACLAPAIGFSRTWRRAILVRAAARGSGMKICVVGAGAIGGFIGTRLALTGAHAVSALARGATLQALHRDGWRLREGGALRSVPALAAQQAAE